MKIYNPVIKNELEVSGSIEHSGSLLVRGDLDVEGNINGLGFSNLISSSAQVDFAEISNKPDGLVSSSAQLQLDGVISSSAQLSYFDSDLTVSGSLVASGSFEVQGEFQTRNIVVSGALLTSPAADGRVLKLGGYNYFYNQQTLTSDKNYVDLFVFPENSSGTGKLQYVHSGSNLIDFTWAYDNNTGSFNIDKQLNTETKASYTAAVYGGGTFRILANNNDDVIVNSFIETFSDDVYGIDSGSFGIEIQYVVVGGGGGGGYFVSGDLSYGGGGGAGGYNSLVLGEPTGTNVNLIDASFTNSYAENYIYSGNLKTDFAYNVTVGAGGASNVSGSNSVFGEVVSIGGGAGNWLRAPNEMCNGGSGGGSVGYSVYNGVSIALYQGFEGGTRPSSATGGGGGGAGSVGSGNGGAGIQTNITGTPIRLAGGGGGGYNYGIDGGGNGARGGTSSVPGTVNSGGGGGGNKWLYRPQYNEYENYPSSQGGSGVVIIKFSSTYNISVSAGLTYEEVDNGDANTTVIKFTAGTGNISFTEA